MNYQNKQLEDAVLGYLLFASINQPDIVPTLSADIFYNVQNRIIYDEIVKVVSSGGTADIMYLQKFDEIDITYLVDLSQKSIKLNPKWVDELEELSRKRKLTKTYLDALQNLETSDSRDCVDSVNLIHDEVLSIGSNTGQTKAEIIAELDASILRAKENKGIQGLKITGINGLDKMLNGAEKGDLIIVAARPSVGKSLLASNIASEGINRKMSMIIWSLEMSASQYLGRVISNQSNLNYGDMRSGRMEINDDMYISGKQDFHNSKVEIIDKHGVDVDEIRSEILSRNTKNPIEALVIDYGGLIRSSKMSAGKSTNDQYGYTSGRLKQLAKELSIPVILLWQLNREVERRNPSIPRLSDLRDSGNIEQDADKVVFIYRRLVHNQHPTWDDMSLDHLGVEVPEDFTLFKVGKNRNGQIGSVPAMFVSENMKFIDYEGKFHSGDFDERDTSNDNIKAQKIMKADITDLPF